MNTAGRFGQTVPGYEVPVLNEREVRAGAGILFALALIAFMNAWLAGDFRPTRIFVIAFLVDFTVRLAIGPRFAPSLILGRFAVRRQQPEWTGAPQKRFAWAIGWVLAAVMAYLIVLREVVGPVNMLVCLACLTLLFFETAFGICIGCAVYNTLYRGQARHCPGDVCVPADTPRGRTVDAGATVVLVLFVIFVFLLARHVFPAAEPAAATTPSAAAPADSNPSADCTPPAWAVSMGHAEKWKLHHGCR